MLPKSNVLLRFESPKLDESFMGYAVRLTEKNGYSTPLWILNHSKINGALINVGCPFVFSRSTDLTYLAALTNQRIESLEALLCPPVGGAGKLMQRMFGQPVPKHLIRLKHSKICPRCLRESSYHRKVWDLAVVTACPVHECFLLDECPNCRKKLSWFRKRVSVCRCGYDWRNATTLPIIREEIRLTKFVYKQFGLPDDQCGTGLPVSTPLIDLELKDVLTAVLAIASQYSGINDAKGKILTTSHCNDALHALLLKGFRAFDEWPDNYYKFLEWKRTQKTNALKWGVNHEFSGYYDLLNRPLSSKNFDFMRISFEEYLKNKWDGGLVYKRTVKLTKNDGGERKYLPQAEVVQELRVGDEVLNRLVEKRLLKCIVRRNTTHKVLLFSRENVQAVKSMLEQLLSPEKAAKALGVREDTVKELLRNGCLKAFDGPTVTEHRYWRINPEEVKRLINAFDRKSVKTSLVSKEHVLAFRKAIFKIISHGISAGAFIKAILEGEISPCGKSKGIGLSGYEFSEENLRIYIKKHRQRLKGSALQLGEVAAAIGVKPASASFFIKRGFIPSQKVKIGNCTITVVPADAIQGFKSTYILATTLSAEYKTSPKFLVRCLKETGVQPCSGHEIDGGEQYLYICAHLEHLNVASLILKTKPLSPKTPSRRIVGAEIAAKILHVNAAKLDRLIQLGIIKPSLRKKDGLGKLTITYASIEKYLDAGIDCTKLLPMFEVVELLGESSSSFSNRWVRTNRIKPVTLRQCGNRRFFFVSDVQALIKFKKKIINSAEAEKILNVHHVTLYKWTAAGKIKPVSGPSVDGFGCNMFLRGDVMRLCEQLQAVS